ncbi:glycosyltransferase family 4 protein [Mongoliitalea daihaiensis]|uniref:glycosyltransferase family 4 protein n=1 Tax=Mongoliitalea daihaiensis TaxID=2782006 RepID=UPI001F36357E|nr:glycosyltransferase family 4 protein [Mongoliitalea daihaiensis]UJP63579.1 glycosyltransferase family 4 protein [Mongoliitalea daihaiensis]
MPKLIRLTTVPLSLKLLLSGQMRFMKDQGWDVLMVSSDGKELSQVIKNEGCRHEVIPFTRQITPFKDLYCLWLLYKLFKREKPDIIHSHTPKAGLLAMVAGALAGVKIRIHTLAGLPHMAASDNKKALLEMAEKWTYRYASEVWPNAYSLKNLILEKGWVGERKIRVIGKGSSNGIDLKKFSREALAENHLVAATMRMTPGENEFIIICIGRLVKDKGIEELVEAFLQSQIIKHSKLVLLGAFEQELNPISDEVMRKISDHPKIVQIDWTDHVAHYLALADLVVHPSHREGFPNVLLEAGAMQVPILCSDIPGNTDIVQNRKTGLVFPVKDIETLKQGLEFAFVKRDFMQELADQLYQQVVENYNRRNIQLFYREAYEELLSANPAKDLF